MVRSVEIRVIATEAAFEEGAYLRANPDVDAAVRAGAYPTGRDHFIAHGFNENRFLDSPDGIEALREEKLTRLRPCLRQDMAHAWRGAKADYLTPELREETRIISTSAFSSNDYDGHALDLIEACSDGLVLDCGAGARSVYYENVVNYEIADYPSTDVLGVGEHLPFADASFDGVISVAVLEHVRDPFQCAREISRVLKPGGRLYCSVPFLQPYHGYPHHYFNATAQGIRRLFEDQLTVLDVDVIASGHPIWALQWLTNAWCDGLTPDTLERFKRMTVGELMGDPMRMVDQPFCRELSKDKLLEIACATVLHARKAE